MNIIFKSYIKRTSRCIILLFIFLQSYSLFAMPERNVSFDAGVGMPQLLFVQGQVVISNHFQAGVGYSLLPISMLFASGIELSPQTVSLSHEGTEQLFSITPRVRPSSSVISPFIRYFPSATRNTYIQLTYPLYQLTASISGPLIPIGGDASLTSYISSTVTITQPLPTLSLGHVFSGKLFFFNLSIGASFFTRTQSDISIGGNFADALNDSESNQAALEELKVQFNNSINEAAAQFKSRLFLIPSLNITFGLLL